MENWRIALDRYITREPDGSFDFWVEKVIDKLSDPFWDENEEWTESELCNDWLEKLFNADTEPGKAAVIIERAFNRYKKFINDA